MCERGLNKIISIKASMNKRLSKRLLDLFLDTQPEHRNIIEYKTNLDTFWVTGFIDGEGCFYVKISKAKRNKEPKVSVKL